MRVSSDVSEYSFSIEPVEVDTVATANRNIRTSIPAPGTREVFERLSKVESRSMHGQLPIVWARANGHSVFDESGNQWIDFTSTIFVANVGHSNERVVSNIKATASSPLLSCYAYSNRLRLEYLERLIAFAGPPFEKAFLLSAGTEATEAAFKLMKMYGDARGKRRKVIICIENNWHGRTLGAQLMCSNESQKAWIGKLDPEIYHISFPYPWLENVTDWGQFLRDELKELEKDNLDLARDVSGFMLETFQGWGAVFYPKEFVKALKEVSTENDILITFDEMQSGFARTGKNFGFQHYEIEPDLICVGKGMGGGVPLSGVLGRASIMDLPSVGNMSSTHSANPLVCAAGLAVLDEIEENNLSLQAMRKGKLMRDALEAIKAAHSHRVSWVLGEGLIMAILFSNPATGEPDSTFASRVAELCMRKGVLVVHTGRESIKLGPPLTISDDALLEGLEVLAEAIREVETQWG